MSIGLPHLDLGGLRRHTDDVPESRLPKIDLSKVELPKPDLAAAGRAVGGGVDALTRRLDELGQEVRSIRVVRGPEPRVAPLPAWHSWVAWAPAWPSCTSWIRAWGPPAAGS